MISENSSNNSLTQNQNHSFMIECSICLMDSQGKLVWLLNNDAIHSYKRNCQTHWKLEKERERKTEKP